MVHDNSVIEQSFCGFVGEIGCNMVDILFNSNVVDIYIFYIHMLDAQRSILNPNKSDSELNAFRKQTLNGSIFFWPSDALFPSDIFSAEWI